MIPDVIDCAIPFEAPAVIDTMKASNVFSFRGGSDGFLESSSFSLFIFFSFFLPITFFLGRMVSVLLQVVLFVSTLISGSFLTVSDKLQFQTCAAGFSNCEPDTSSFFSSLFYSVESL